MLQSFVATGGDLKLAIDTATRIEITFSPWESVQCLQDNRISYRIEDDLKIVLEVRVLVRALRE